MLQIKNIDNCKSVIEDNEEYCIFTADLVEADKKDDDYAIVELTQRDDGVLEIKASQTAQDDTQDATSPQEQEDSHEDKADL